MLDQWLLEKLVCPLDKCKLKYDDEKLVSLNGRTYPVINGVPVLLFDDGDVTHPAFYTTLKSTQQSAESSSYNAKSLSDSNLIDLHPYVQEQIAATNGNLYLGLIGNLPRYPIPTMRLPEAVNGELLLDIGCNWGRWSISAAQKGFRVIGVDPNLEAILAAKKVCQQLNITSVHFVVADARHLPFARNTFDHAFSYSEFQHLNKNNVKQCLSEINDVLTEGGSSFIQMPNRYGIKNLYNQVKRVNKLDNNFRVRYWTISELMSTFSEKIGQSEITVDGFFGLGIQPADIDMLPLIFKVIVRTSEFLRHFSAKLPFLKYIADSIYIRSVKTNKFIPEHQ